MDNITEKPLYDVAAERILLKSPISRKAQVVVVAYGDVDVAALDKLIEMLTFARNGWDD